MIQNSKQPEPDLDLNSDMTDYSNWEKNFVIVPDFLGLDKFR